MFIETLTWGLRVPMIILHLMWLHDGKAARLLSPFRTSYNLSQWLVQVFRLIMAFPLSYSTQFFVSSTLLNRVQIIRERLPEYPLRNGLVWNNAPGALLTLPTFADSPLKMPFLLDTLNQEPGHNFTAVIFVQIGSGKYSKPAGPYTLCTKWGGAEERIGKHARQTDNIFSLDADGAVFVRSSFAQPCKRTNGKWLDLFFRCLHLLCSGSCPIGL